MSKTKEVLHAHNNYTSLFLIIGLLIVFVPAVETKFFPAASPMKISNIQQDGINHVTFFGESERLRPECNFVSLEWFLGERDGRNVPADIITGPPELRDDGKFTFGPWFVNIIPPEEFINNSYADALHKCSYFSRKAFWLTRSHFWN